MHLDSAEHIAAMLDAATDLQRNTSGRRRTVGRRALVATLDLRRTSCERSMRPGRDPAYVMGQFGHADARFTLRISTHVMRALRALVEGRHWAPMGTRGAATPSEVSAGDTLRMMKPPT